MKKFQDYFDFIIVTATKDIEYGVCYIHLLQFSDFCFASGCLGGVLTLFILFSFTCSLW